MAQGNWGGEEGREVIIEMFCIMIMVVVSQVYSGTKVGETEFILVIIY